MKHTQTWSGRDLTEEPTRAQLQTITPAWSRRAVNIASYAGRAMPTRPMALNPTRAMTRPMQLERWNLRDRLAQFSPQQRIILATLFGGAGVSALIVCVYLAHILATR